MTTEEAIKYLKAAQLTNGTAQTGFVGVPWAEVFETAIEALEKQIPEDVVVYNREWLCPCCGESLDFNNKKVSRCKCGKVLRWVYENN